MFAFGGKADTDFVAQMSHRFLIFLGEESILSVVSDGKLPPFYLSTRALLEAVAFKKCRKTDCD
jgi:hypothetical protein